MTALDHDTKQAIRNLVVDFFAEECGVERGQISDETNIIEELDGDSLMLLALLRTVSADFGFTVDLATIGQRLMDHPASTIREVVQLTNLLVEHAGDLTSVEL